MSHRGLLSSSEKAVAEVLRQLEDIDFDTEVEWNENEINQIREANIVEELIDSIIQESLINKINQRDEGRSDNFWLFLKMTFA